MKFFLLLLLSRFSHVQLCNPIDGSPRGFSVPGILQARTLERVAISFSSACMHAKSLRLCPTLCDPIDDSPPGCSVPGILQARTLEWVAISFSGGSSRPRNQTWVFCICKWILYQLSYEGSLENTMLLLLQSCLTLRDPVDSSPPGSSVPGILQARTLEWVAISFSNA